MIVRQTRSNYNLINDNWEQKKELRQGYKFMLMIVDNKPIPRSKLSESKTQEILRIIKD